MMRWSCVLLSMCFCAALQAQSKTYDVVIYGGTSSGVAAAVQASRMGKSVVLIEPGKHLGGLTSGGLGATDIGNKAAIGGISREFYRRVKLFYEQPAAWRQEKREEYRSPRQSGSEDTMWTFEPQVAERCMKDLIQEAKVEVLYDQRLDLKNGVQKQAQGNHIQSIRMESGRVFAGKRFIDATYEGDLMAEAGVAYTVGREANSKYSETLNGVQTRNAIHHQFMLGVDPFKQRGDPASGLVSGLHPGPPGEEGAADQRVQAYCFRMCVTDAESNRIPFEHPAGYDEQKYELLFRNFEAGEKRIPWSPTLMPNRKTDTNNNFGFSTDYIGSSYEWPDGDYATRDRIYEDHLQYQRGLMWTLANHPRVPESIRREVSRWGNCKDEFAEHAGWSHQIYVREARRMISDCVMTQHHCQGQEVISDSVGLAAYTMDSHNVQRYVDAKKQVRNEGDVQVGGFPPYGISYRSIVPRESQCDNLLVPVCLAATHIAYGSIRMEPVFMVLGQSAATAACQSIDANVSVQKLSYDTLRKQLLEDKQVLVWTGPVPAKNLSVDSSKLKGIVMDDDVMERFGDWLPSRSIGGYVGTGYWHDANEAKGQKTVQFPTKVKSTGMYEVRLSYTANSNRATNVPVTIRHADGESKVKVNQRLKPPLENGFVSVGKYKFRAGEDVVITVSNDSTDGHVIVDAVQIIAEN
jgi:hypothetical protein